MGGPARDRGVGRARRHDDVDHRDPAGLIAARALIVGVGATTFGDGLFAPLPGIATDVRRVGALLRERGFDPQALDTPGRDAVKAALTTLVDATAAGDLSVVYLAGHGYRAPDDSGDEEDGWDECFVCADGALRDDWFRDGLWVRARDGARFVVVVDACHSSTMVRALAPTPPLPLPTRPGGFSRLVLSACRDEETALELAGGDEGGGVVTTEMVAAVEHDPAVTYRELWPRVGAAIATRFGPALRQRPQLSFAGPDDALLRAPAFTAI